MAHLRYIFSSMGTSGSFEGTFDPSSRAWPAKWPCLSVKLSKSMFQGCNNTDTKLKTRTIVDDGELQLGWPLVTCAQHQFLYGMEVGTLAV